MEGSYNNLSFSELQGLRACVREREEHGDRDGQMTDGWIETDRETNGQRYG